MPITMIIPFTLKRLQTLLCVLLVLALHSRLTAQTLLQPPDSNDDPDIVKLSPFLVTQKQEQGYSEQQTLAGSRSVKKLIDIPGTVVILNKDVLEDLGATTVVQALNFGVSGISQGTGYFDAVNIRGFGNPFSLRNGVNKISFKTSPMYDVERVEVIKGPAAMLLGNNSFLGGSVNLISRRASGSPAGDVQATFSDNNYIRAVSTVTGPAVKTDRLRVNYRVTAGAVTADRDKDIQNEDEKFIGGAIDVYLGSETSLLLNWYVFQNDGYRYWEDFLDITTGKAFPGAAGGRGSLLVAKLNQNSTRSFSPGRSKDVFWRNNDSFFDLTFLTKLTDKGNLRAYFAVTSLRDVRQLLRGISVQADNYTLNRQLIPFNYDLVDQNFQLDYLHEFNLHGAKFSTTLGIDGYRTDYRQALSVLTPSPLDTRQAVYPDDDAFFSANASAITGPKTASDNIQKPTQFSHYAQEDISLWQDRLIIVGGLRWITPGGYNRNVRTNVMAERPDKTLKVHKYGAVVKIIPGISVYYTDVINVRQQVGFVDLNTGGDQKVPQKDSEGILKEFGVKFERKLSEKINFYGSIVHYDMAVTNVRINYVFPDGTPGVIQNARDTAKGWEFDYGMQMRFANGHSDLIATYADGKSATAADPTLEAGGFMPKKASLIAKYTWSGGAIKGLMLGAGWVDQSPTREGSYVLDHPTLINLFARYPWGKHWEIQANVNNLTDERYITGYATPGLVEASEARQVRVNLKYRW